MTEEDNFPGELDQAILAAMYGLGTIVGQSSREFDEECEAFKEIWEARSRRDALVKAGTTQEALLNERRCPTLEADATTAFSRHMEDLEWLGPARSGEIHDKFRDALSSISDARTFAILARSLRVALLEEPNLRFPLPEGGRPTEVEVFSGLISRLEQYNSAAELEYASVPGGPPVARLRVVWAVTFLMQAYVSLAAVYDCLASAISVLFTGEAEERPGQYRQTMGKLNRVFINIDSIQSNANWSRMQAAKGTLQEIKMVRDQVVHGRSLARGWQFPKGFFSGTSSVSPATPEHKARIEAAFDRLRHLFEATYRTVLAFAHFLGDATTFTWFGRRGSSPSSANGHSATGAAN